MYYLVYGLLWLISLLPFSVLYFISDAFYGLLYYVIGYRKEVVMKNLLIAFPEKTEKERIRIAKKFYHNLVDYFLETIKLITLSDKEFYKRCSGNFEEVNRLAATGTNIQLHSGHQFNWEWANRIYSQKLTIPFVLVYMRLSNKAMDRIFKKIRLKHGTVLIDATNYKRDMLRLDKVQHAFALVADQNPGNTKTAFWLNFFSKPAPFLYTPEKNAQRNNLPVGFASFKKVKRGYYTFETTIITLHAAETTKGELTRKYRDFLEQQIREQPDNYLWSHRRWKFEFTDEHKKGWID
jgi:Kdo2-lipid IVA lauroyltransferase/acyltransferase